MSSYPTSIWKRSPNKLRQGEIWLECFCFISLFLAALVLFLVNLGNLPLIDLKEGVVAQVAKEIYQGFGLGDNWIFPTLWGEPYLEQPTLVPDLIAIAYKVAGVSEFTTRLPGALLGAVSVLLLYNIGREIFVARLPALFSALVYLTCLPVLRLSRLAMLDGPLLCFELLTIWAILRSRRDFRWSLLAGIGLALMALTKGILSLQILVIALVFLLWDTPRLLTSTYYWAGIILGTAPAIAWYVAQWFHYHEFKTTGDFFHLFLGDISATAIQVQLFPEYYLLSGLQYLLPWLVVMAMGLKLISLNLEWGWGKLLITWIGIYTILSLAIFSQGYWSILPLYPALALAAGRQLDVIRNVPSYIAYPRIWIYSFMLMAAVAAFAGLYWGIRDYVDFYLPFICGSLAITFTVTAIAIAQREKQFVPLLFWGLFISMFLLIISPHWIWEINTKEPVEPIATLIREHTPAETIIYTSMPKERSSLNFYSDRQVVTQSFTQLKQTWEQNYPVYLLLDPLTLEKLNLSQQIVVKSSKFESLKWVLAIKNS